MHTVDIGYFTLANRLQSSVYQLTALAGPLESVRLAGNPRVTDGCVSSLRYLPLLKLLGLEGTSVTMEGLRRLASTFHAERRPLQVRLPEECMQYLDGRLHIPFSLSHIQG